MDLYGYNCTYGWILYLNEIVEARKDTIVAIHPLTDHRRALTMDKLACVLEAPSGYVGGELQPGVSILY